MVNEGGLNRRREERKGENEQALQKTREEMIRKKRTGGPRSWQAVLEWKAGIGGGDKRERDEVGDSYFIF